MSFFVWRLHKKSKMDDTNNKVESNVESSAVIRPTAAEPSCVLEEYDIIDDQNVENQQNEETNQVNKDQDAEISSKPADSQNQIRSRNRLSSSERSNSTAESQSMIVRCPRVNCKEKIVSLMRTSALVNRSMIYHFPFDAATPIILWFHWYQAKKVHNK